MLRRYVRKEPLRQAIADVVNATFRVRRPDIWGEGGVLRHCTEMTVERQYVDSHGQTEIGFAFSQLLGFQLLPRFKSIVRQKLYRPDTGAPEAYPSLQPVLTRPIRWDLIRQQYDEMIKYATALRLGTADAESILRRFTRDAPVQVTSLL